MQTAKAPVLSIPDWPHSSEPYIMQGLPPLHVPRLDPAFPPTNPSRLPRAALQQANRAKGEGERELINKRAIVQSSLYHNDGRTLPCLGGNLHGGMSFATDAAITPRVRHC